MVVLNKQRGLSMGSFLTGIVIVVFLAIVGMKLVPAYIEYMTINKIFHAMSSDADVATCRPNSIAVAFVHQATTQYGISSIAPDDINCDNSSSTVVISADYSVKVPLAGNVSLVVDFHPTSAH